jgi:hypothetical protein
MMAAFAAYGGSSIASLDRPQQLGYVMGVMCEYLSSSWHARLVEHCGVEAIGAPGGPSPAPAPKPAGDEAQQPAEKRPKVGAAAWAQGLCQGTWGGPSAPRVRGPLAPYGPWRCDGGSVAGDACVGTACPCAPGVHAVAHTASIHPCVYWTCWPPCLPLGLS